MVIYMQEFGRKSLGYWRQISGGFVFLVISGMPYQKYAIGYRCSPNFQRFGHWPSATLAAPPGLKATLYLETCPYAVLKICVPQYKKALVYGLLMLLCLCTSNSADFVALKPMLPNDPSRDCHEQGFLSKFVFGICLIRKNIYTCCAVVLLGRANNSHHLLSTLSLSHSLTHSLTHSLKISPLLTSPLTD